MKISFPNLGNSVFAAKAIFDGLGIEYILPKESSIRSLEIGALHSPDEICLPFKIMLGNYIESIEQGADTIIITGSCGPCRYGEYCELQMNILKKLGYNVEFIVVDKPNAIGNKEFLSRISQISKGSEANTLEKLNLVAEAYKIVKLMDRIESLCRYKVGYEVKEGSCKALLAECKKKALQCKSDKDMLEHLKKYLKYANTIPIDESKKPLKIAIIGEIYTILEPFSNFHIEDKLMDFGICSFKGLNPSWWVKDAILSATKLNSIGIRRNSRKYLPLYIGGHARECVGEAVLAKKKGFHGAIQIYPVGCMPEIVSRAILPTISKDEDFPIMTLVVDEMTGEAGYVTRLEAFIDLIERKEKNVVYGR